MERESLVELVVNKVNLRDRHGAVQAITEIAEMQTNISDEEALLFVNAIELYIHDLVSALRVLYLIVDENPNNGELTRHLGEKKDDLSTRCEECYRLIDSLIYTQSTSEKLMIMKLKADIGFFNCQVAENDNSIVIRTEEDYKLAWNVAMDYRPTNTTVMSTAVNFSVFLMEIKKDKEAAIHNVKTALALLPRAEECVDGKEALYLLLKMWQK